MLPHAGKPPAAIKFKSAKKAAASSSSYHAILRKFQRFKQFDIVRDASDHHFIGENSSLKQHPKNWAKAIQKEWKILEKDLPDSIFVRVYELRMDLLRAIIIGAEGTPYHDGLFFFDLYFPNGYPNVPLQVYPYSSSNQLNPNFHYTGRICLSLLNTWYGSKNERWLPGVSTILQEKAFLVLNARPFFNNPPGEVMRNYIPDAESISLRYKNFEDFVVGHFVSRAHDILGACNAYIEGAQVGSLDKGGVQDVGVRNSWEREHVPKEQCVGLVRVLMNTLFGAKDCEKFLSAEIIKAGQHIFQFHESINYAPL